MQNLQEELKELLIKDDNLVVEGHLNKNKIIESALRLDPKLLKSLLSCNGLKKHFFEDVDDILVFDKIKFQRFINNKSFLPDSYTAFKNKVGLVINDGLNQNYISSGNDVVLAWPHKDCVLEGGQTKDEKSRDEIFWNETLAPDEVDRLLDAKVFTNWEKVDKNGSHEVASIDRSDNLIIKGNNLLSISSLLKVYRNRVKVIYIDPPYNTGGGGDTFSYNNSFKRSTWLTFMKNRLVIAKQLLKDDGVLITAIDDHEFASLRLLLEEIFVGYTFETVVVNHHPQGSGGLNISTTHEYAIFTIPAGKRIVKGEYIEEAEEEWSLIKSGAGEDYYRIGRPNMFFALYVDKESRKVMGVGPELGVNETYSTEDTPEGWKQVYPLDGSGDERRWRYGRDTMIDLVKNNKIICSKRGSFSLKVVKNREDVYKPVYSNWVDKKYNAGPHGTALIQKLVPGEKFSFPKSLYTVKDAIKAVVQDDKEAIILDYHAGSGTTGHAVLELNKEDGGNRKFILCEQMDYIKTITYERVKKVIEDNGEGSFVYIELNKYNQSYIDRVQGSTNKNELLSVWNDMKEKSFLSYRFNKKAFEKNINDFVEMDLTQMKQFLIEVLDKNQLYINYSEIEDKALSISSKDIKLNHQFYSQK